MGAGGLKIMGTKNQTMHQIIASVVAGAGLSISVGATAKVAPPPRGADVQRAAGGCAIGPFPQTMKAGPYNVLCSSMQDAEKCLAFIKGHFLSNGSTVETSAPDKMEYCLDTLKKDLGAGRPL